MSKSKFSKKDQGNIWLWVAGGGSVEELVPLFPEVTLEDIKNEVRRQIKEMEGRK